MFTPFGSQQMLDFGYILDIKSSMPYSILPLIITDANFICAKRIVLGVNDISVASQIVTSWSYGVENSTAAIEYPRFIIDNNNTIGLEGIYYCFKEFWYVRRFLSIYRLEVNDSNVHNVLPTVSKCKNTAITIFFFYCLASATNLKWNL